MSEDEHNYTFYGNSLEPLNEDDVARRKPIPLEDQVATDKQGRRRFHGAFTGGFSAGFFNSVGSLEGWKPATFQSSRAEKAEKRQQRPEDFMDDEDQDVFGIAPQVLRAKADYSDTRSRPGMTSSDLEVIPGSLNTLGEILKPVRESVGVRLLKRMGWKPGQGVGPRVSKKDKNLQRKQNEERRVYGCDMGPLTSQPQSADQHSSSDTSDYDDVTFAPEDLPTFLVKPKTNTFGMGYTGLDRTPVLSGTSSGHFNLFEPPSIINAAGRGGRGKSIRGQAFGVGAFEAEDEDIYSTEDMSRYDFALESVGESRKKRWQDKQQQIKKQSSGSKVQCLEGFCVSSKPMSTLQYFPPPSLPKDYVPKHVSKQSRFSKATVEVPGEHKKSGLGRHDLTAEQRSILLGDAPPRSTDKRKIEEVDLTLDDQQPGTKLTRLTSDIAEQPTQQLQVAPTELKSSQFNPFSHDPDKLLRYQKYLTLVKQNNRDMLSSLQPSSMTEWERSRERNEFEQAARLYQPLAGPISDRFVSSATLLGHDEKSHLEPTLVEASVSAAKLKMFGKLTRTREAWQPCSLLCKRFNVPEPNSGAPMTSSRKRATFSVFDFLSAATQNNVQATDDVTTERVDVVSSEAIKCETTTVTSEVIDLAEEPEQNLVDKVDLYKAIFLSSSEDEGEEPPLSAPPTTKPPLSAPSTSQQSAAQSPPHNLIRNTSPPRGVFANIFQVVPPPHTPTTPPSSPPNKPQTPPHLPPDIYGPSLPSSSEGNSAPKVTPIIPSLPLNFPSKGSKWVEKTKKDKKKKKHKKHKSKSKKKKKESKSKKHKKRDKSSSSSSSSD